LVSIEFSGVRLRHSPFLEDLIMSDQATSVEPTGAGSPDVGMPFLQLAHQFRFYIRQTTLPHPV
jgi:hypothetical protein